MTDTNKLTFSVEETCKATSLGRTNVFALIKSGKLKSTTVGNRRLIDAQSVRDLVAPKEVRGAA